MGRGRVFKKGNMRYLELPPDLSECDDLELFFLREGFYLLCTRLENGKTQQYKPIKKEEGPVLGEDEKKVLKKLFSIRFEKRIPSNVKRIITTDDADSLDRLVKRDLVNILKSKKYPEGVYNIDNGIYAMLNSKTGHPQSRPVRKTQKRKAEKKENPYSLLMKNGFLVLKDKNEAFAFSNSVKSEIKNGKIKGIKGFDNKFYAVTEDYLENSSDKIMKALTEDGDIGQIAERSGLNQEGCKAIIKLLAERGDVIEKRKGVFSSI